LRGQEGATLADETVNLVANDPNTRQRADVCAVLQSQLQKPWSHLHSLGRRVPPGHNEGERLAFSRRLALHLDTLRHVNDRIEHVHKAFRQLEREHYLLAS